MYSTPINLSVSYLRSAVEASLDIKKDHVDPNSTNLVRSQVKELREGSLFMFEDEAGWKW